MRTGAPRRKANSTRVKKGKTRTFNIRSNNLGRVWGEKLTYEQEREEVGILPLKTQGVRGESRKNQSGRYSKRKKQKISKGGKKHR